MTAASIFAQPGAGVRFEWGLAGALALREPTAAMVIVDVLSFTTAVSVAVGLGTSVYPHPWPSPDLQEFARDRRAVCAVARCAVDVDHPWSLSPAHILSAPAAERLVLPSPNGSAIADQLRAAGAVVAGCLRNATTVAGWLADHGFGRPERPAIIIAAGERWPSGELRPALEDLLGAGAVIAGFPAHLGRSPEAAATEAAWHAHRGHLANALRDCSSGRELIGSGYRADVDLASEADGDLTVPRLVDGAFQSADVTSKPT